MSLSLYEATVPSFAQIIEAMAGVLKKGEAHAIETGMQPDEWVNARLFSDMAPLSFQVKQAAHHSVGALEATKKGVFSPDQTPPPQTFADLRSTVASTLSTLAAYDPAEINSLQGRDMRFQLGERIMPFTAENFLLSFSLPNFYFHATTAYDILRHNGVALGKRDYIGQPRLKV